MMIAEASKTWEGRVVEGKFPLRQKLGESDHSVVFLTERGGQAASKAAIKLIPASGLDVERQLSRWRAAAQLSHPNIVRIFQAGSCRIDNAPLLYVVTEYADEDLSQILPHRPLTAAEVGDMLPPLVDAISYLHHRGLVHGRIKPSNVLAIGDQLKLSPDHISSRSEGETRRRDVYDAPETAAGILSPEGDIWSVGVTLLAAMTQNPSLTSDSRGDPTVPRSIPEPFRGIIRECLHLDPRRRCSTSDIMARLQPAARSVPAEHAAEAAAAPAARKGISRGAVGLAIVVLAVLIALLVFYSRGHREATRVPTVPETKPDSAPVNSRPSASSQASVPAQAPDSSEPAVSSRPSPSPERRAHNSPPNETAKPEPGGVAVHQVLPDVPRSARNTITGKIKVVVQVDVNPAGKVTAAKLTTSGPSQYFANLAMKSARQWEFSPPTIDGQPQPSVWAIRFRFGRARTEATPERLKRP